MSRRFVLTVVKVSYSPASPWMVSVPTRLHRIEGATNKFFEREGGVKAYVERLAREMGNYQAQALGLSDKQKMETAECLDLFENEKVSLLEAVQHYLGYRKE